MRQTINTEPELFSGSLRVPSRAALTEVEAPRPVLSIVLPTKNERGNIRPLFERLERALEDVDVEVIVVDDSDDGTAMRAARLAARMPYDVRVIERKQAERSGGLSAAVVAGIRAARGTWVCVMDADLQHPPEVIRDLLGRARRGNVDVVVASRYCAEGASRGFGRVRALVSRAVTTSARMLFPRRLRGVSDPMSGFFLVRPERVEVDRLRPQGFKILLEILASHDGLRRAEVPFEFGVRHAGDSKASLRQGLIYLSQLTRLRFGSRCVDLIRFCAVGLSGLLVNMAAFVLLSSTLGLNYLAAAVLSTQVSTLWNFLLSERWVFARRATGRALPRAAVYFLMNNAALLLRGPILVVLVSVFALGPTLANFLSLVVLTIIRFAVADSFIWRSVSPGPHAYEIHGLASVVSDVALPELEAFRTQEVPPRPSIRVRIGRLSRHQSDLVKALLSQARFQTKHLRYDEGLGPLGFSVEFSSGPAFEIVAAPLLRLSPHVLYTNVVEPVLRWTFVKKGYALVHGACIAADNEAVLITAKTDTGKTTTILKVLDAQAYDFLSDDLTLVNEEGDVLSYPKPLTISRHTARAVSTPLLGLRERMRLVYQSRIHSRSGRRFAMVIARLRLPAATINALVQLLIPPPKYHIDRLVPHATVARSARLRRMFVIERGARSQFQIDTGSAVETLLANSDDAFGFPPYSAIASFLTEHEGGDLHLIERDIVSKALATAPALVLRSDSMDWWKHFVEERDSAKRDEVASAVQPGAIA